MQRRNGKNLHFERDTLLGNEIPQSDDCVFLPTESKLHVNLKIKSFNYTLILLRPCLLLNYNCLRIDLKIGLTELSHRSVEITATRQRVR